MKSDQCDWCKDATDGRPRCEKPATRKWGDNWFCEEHGRRNTNPMTNPNVSETPLMRCLPETKEAWIRQNIANQAMADKDWPWKAIEAGWLFANDLERQRDAARAEVERWRAKYHRMKELCEEAQAIAAKAQKLHQML